MFWELMEKFSHEERGLVLKFATGAPEVGTTTTTTTTTTIITTTVTQ